MNFNTQMHGIIASHEIQHMEKNLHDVMNAFTYLCHDLCFSWFVVMASIT